MIWLHLLGFCSNIASLGKDPSEIEWTEVFYSGQTYWWSSKWIE